MKYILVFIALGFLFPAKAQDTSTVMFYNLLQFPNQKPERVSYLKEIVQEVKPDILMVCELSNNTGSVTILNQALNTNGINYYQRATFWDDGSFNNMLYYNARAYKLLKQDTIACTPRFATVYQLLHKPALANGDSIVSYYIVVHLKAGSSDAAERARAAKKIRFYIDNKTNGKNVFLAGDFNIYSPSEGAFEAFTKNGKIKLSDPINEIGEWSNNDYYAPIHTQSTRTLSFGGGSTGGMDDRFDWILASGDVINGSNNIEYVLGSYKAYGNDGKHFNNAINFKENTAAPANIINALHEMSDHLPVVMKVANSFTNSISENGQEMVNARIENGQLFLVNKMGYTHASLFSIHGQLIAEKSLNTINEGVLFNGLEKNNMYLLVLKNNKQTLTKRLIAR